LSQNSPSPAPALARRDWPPEASERLVQALARRTASQAPRAIAERIDALARRNLEIHDLECVNLNPATNVMNPRAEAMLAGGLGSRPSLGYPGGKYEMGLEAIEEIR
jgi:glycine hydroxymethyltransferase